MNLKNKEEMRNLIWDTLERKKISKYPKNWHGRIPDFYGSDLAAGVLRSTAEWKKSSVIFSSPDSAQKKVREYTLLDYKTLIMASPNLERGYILIRASDARGNEKIASTKEGAFRFGETIETFPKVDLVVEGSVAVDMSGGRLGKGKGYGDTEISHLFKEKSIDEDTVIATTVHETQIVDKVPREVHDQKINMIITPERVIGIGKGN
ncbi:5-formyltetrahydrofolate cyclo-ligase [Methanobacterium paludis]|uniref:5-formyltetrahydrofolate cyclo-ligase n=1 Tax=Methanobacterium paludis (strain DSM 25820 / JCM 18151 / SWAN1) TaxID=868131 RepID=F6D252_METPW|nr:5-formyltetrahydrofolate cyclo-ligase [Methanobacterium paludis]AEG17918.1 5-formyltetrahydrofolate cyclo-ligase [Methanobacterium paludis]